MIKMVYVFGMNLPVMEIQLVLLLLFIVAMIFVIWQMLELRKHVSILERTTFEIKKYEEKPKKR